MFLGTLDQRFINQKFQLPSLFPGPNLSVYLDPSGTCFSPSSYPEWIDEYAIKEIVGFDIIYQVSFLFFLTGMNSDMLPKINQDGHYSL